MAGPTELTVSREGATIALKGTLGRENFRRVLAALGEATEQRGYKDVTLDFSDCVRAFSGSMLAVCSQTIALRAHGVEVAIRPPKNAKLAQLFENSNWLHLLAPATHRKSTFRGHRHVPAMTFQSPGEQHSAVNAILDVILRSLSGLKRGDFAALEWALNEITDNVLTHAEAATGGLVSVSTFEAEHRTVEFIVCDAGATIPGTLRGGRKEIASDSSALELAIREGITRDKSIGQGNGLYGTFEICRQNEGSFQIDSRGARLSYGRTGLQIKREPLPYAGTLVVATIDCSQPGALQRALKFEGQQFSPVDWLETKYETPSGDAIVFVLHDEAASFGSRPAGTLVRNKLANLIQMSGARKVTVVFRGVPIVSSSFADEVFGKLLLQLGPVKFTQSFDFVEISDTVKSLIDKAVLQRMAGR